MKIKIPKAATYVIDKLNDNGYEAYIVGGCVRDAILNKDPHDWDICTEAIPEEMLEVFNDDKVIETGLKHGTITVVSCNENIEVTTYRIDGDYTDARRPDEVTFTKNIESDLSRRDFTINSIAYCDRNGIVDPFGGITDIEKKIIRAVGNPKERFTEDALRILRAIRFSSQLGFTIEQNTKDAIFELKDKLHMISKERISSEFVKILMGENAKDVLDTYFEVICEFIPEILPMKGFDQNTPWHIYDVWEHTINVVDNIQRAPRLRLAAFFHDIGKPETYSIDDDGIGHFYGHESLSADMTREILTRLKFDNKTISELAVLVAFHRAELVPSKKQTRKFLNKLGEEQLRNFVELKRADMKSQNLELHLENMDKPDRALTYIDEIISEGGCYNMKDLAVSGRDLIEIGYEPGVEIGKMLDRVLNEILEENLENNKESIMEYIEMHKSVN